MTTVYFIRHGNTDMPDRVPGRLPGVTLSPTGREQVRALARKMSAVGIHKIVCGPLDRTVETALIIGERCAVVPEVRSGLIEIDFGEWTGCRFDELEADPRWKRFHAFRNGCPVPGGESMVDVQSRMVNEVERLRALYDQARVAVVSHNDPIKSVVAWYAGVPLELFLRLEISTASVSVVSFEHNDARVLLVNGTGPGL